MENLEKRELLSVNPLETSAELIPQNCVILSAANYGPERAPEESIGLNLDSAMNEMLTAQGQNPNALSQSFVFNLNSKPGSNHTIYLDFNGHTTRGTQWNTDYSKTAITTPAYDVDGNTSSFSNQELRNIYEIWLRVSEDYMPFDVNVTTKEPSSDMLTKSSSSDQTYGVRVCIGGRANDWYLSGSSSTTGVSYVDVFDYYADIPSFVFAKDCSTLQHVADSASHETGHALNLRHDGKGSESYYFGASGWAPIMGGAGWQELVQWSKGEYASATNREDDLATISSLIGYRADDHGATLAQATPLTFSIGEFGSGIIERNTDVDYFSFNLNGENAIIKVGGLKNVTNLDVKATIYNQSGTSVGVYAPTDTLYASIDVSNFTPGKYYLKVEGSGKTVNGTTIYSNYGSLGAYKIEASAKSGGAVTQLTAPTYKSTSSTDSSITLAWNAVANASRYVVEYKGENDSTFTPTQPTTATTVMIQNLAAETTYKLRVRAIGDGTNYSDSPYSAVKAVKTKAAVATTPLDAPTWKTTSSTDSSITVTWNAVANASGYVVEYKNENETTFTPTQPTTATTFTIPNLASDTTYKLRVRATGDGVNYSDSPYSVVKAVKTKTAVVTTPLDAPTWKTTSSTDSSITVAWNAVANASGYVVEYKGENNSTFTAAPKTTATTFTIPNLASDTTYKLRVRAIGDGVNYSDSPYSTVKAVKTKAAVETPTIVVTSLADTVNENDGVVTLREAIELYANDGDTITFAPALKGGVITLNGSEITIEKSLKIDASALWDVAQNAPGITINANSQSRIFFILNDADYMDDYTEDVDYTGPTVELNSLTLADGNGKGGGAIYVSSYSTLTISNSTFQNNASSSTYGYGGAIYVSNASTLTISNSTFLNNSTTSAYYGGGAIYGGNSSTLTISNTSFQNNTAKDEGGAICLYYSTASISNSTFQNNSVTGGYGEGGAIYVGSSSAATISDSNFQNNSVTGWNGEGGAIYSWGDLTISNANLQNNTATDGGAFYTNGNLTLSNSNLQNNTATRNGGAIYFSSSSTLAILNSSLTQNKARYGSASYITDFRNTRLFNVTIAGNSASEASGGAIYLTNGKTGAQLDVYNSIVAGNTNEDFYLDSGAGAVNAHNVLSSFSSWSNADAVGYVYSASKPLFTNATQGEYTLATGSQAINKGDNGYVATTTDLDGKLRIMGGTVDLGAYEYAASYGALETPSTVVTSLDDGINITDGVVTLREALELYANAGDTITFAPALKGGVITLHGDEIFIGQSLKIDASALWNKTNAAPGITLDANSRSRIFRTARGVSVELDSLAFTGGNELSGGAIYAPYSALTVSNSTFHNNSASSGGAINANTASISNSSFVYNSCERAGGAIYATVASVSNSTFQSNSATGSYGNGGAISAYSASISNSTFQNNFASNEGGAIRGGDSSRLTISNSSFQNNVSYEGGAIYAGFDSTLTISNSNFQNNSANSEGGALYLWYSTITVSGSIFHNNAASGQTYSGSGGAIYAYQSTPTISNSSFTRNMAGCGSAIDLELGDNYDGTDTRHDPTFFNVTICDNTASEASGGALRFMNEGSNLQINIYNSIVAGNVNGDLATLSLDYNSETQEYIGVDDYLANAYNVLSDFNGWANADAIAFAYDPSKPLFTNAEQGDYTLAAGSQAINRGNNAYVSSETDLAGNARIVGGTVDLGAYENGATLDPIQLDAPTYKSTSSTDRSITVAWNAVANASGYVVEYKGENDSTFTAAPKTTATTITIPNLASDTTYKLRVYAVGDGTSFSDSAYSTVKAVKTKAAAVLTQLTAPTWKSSSSTANSVTVTWNAVANASGYVVEYKGE
ncbi:MAG: fibronectin type III domain-containing protein, partial [Thermoguttaceae bacterium]|nr:fibronectin type III domain-containing protein [Thermoguttaceae bacterium]